MKTDEEKDPGKLRKSILNQFLIPIFKNREDVMIYGNYRGIELT